MTKTSVGVIIQWPDMKLSSLQSKGCQSRMFSIIVEDVHQNPFPKGRELSSDDSITGLVSPLELFAGAGGEGEGFDANQGALNR